MCNCISTVTENILAAQRKSKPERNMLPIDEYDGDGLGNQAFTFSQSSVSGSKLYTPFVYRYTFKKVNGQDSAVRKETVRMFYSFCPFCGEKY